MRVWIFAGLALLCGCMTPMAPNEPPRGDAEDRALSYAYRRSIPHAEERPKSDLTLQVDVDLVEYTLAGAPMVEGAFRSPEPADLSVAGGMDTLARNGLRVGLAGRQFFGMLAGISGSASVRRRTWQSVLLRESARGNVKVGAERTETFALSHCDRRHQMKAIDVAQAGAQLEITPRQLPSGELELRILPVLRYYDQGPQTLSFPDLQIVAIVRDGESIAIGSVSTEAATLGSTFFRSPAGESEVRMAILLTPKMRS